MSLRYAVGLPNVGEFGDPKLLRELSILAEASGWDGVYLWDHVLYDEPSWSVANPTVAAAAIASATSRIRLIIACALARVLTMRGLPQELTRPSNVHSFYFPGC